MSNTTNKILLKKYIFNSLLRYWFVLVVLVVLVVLPKRANAQSFDLSVAPAIFQIELTPPAVADATQSLSLENTGDTPLELEIQLRPFKASPSENGEVLYYTKGEEIQGPDPLIYERVKLLDEDEPVTELTLGPKQQKTLDLTVTIPKDQPPHDYYFSIIFLKKTGKDKPQENTSMAAGGIAVNVLLSIGPKGQTAGVIEEFSAPLFLQQGPVPFKVRVKNTSRHFIYPKGQILIKNMFGQTIGHIELLPVNILSNTVRAVPSKEQFIFEANKDGALPEDQQSITQKLSALGPVGIWNESFLLGPYTATLTMALSDEGPLLTKEVMFIGFPLHILTGLGIALVLTLIIRQRLKTRKPR